MSKQLIMIKEKLVSWFYVAKSKAGAYLYYVLQALRGRVYNEVMELTQDNLNLQFRILNSACTCNTKKKTKKKGSTKK